MARLQDLQSRDTSMRLLIFVSIQPIKLRNSTHFTELLPNKQCCLIASLQKDNLQINAFLASGGRVKKNLEALLRKTIESFGGGAKKKIPSSINESLVKSHSVLVRDQVA